MLEVKIKETKEIWITVWIFGKLNSFIECHYIKEKKKKDLLHLGVFAKSVNHFDKSGWEFECPIFFSALGIMKKQCKTSLSQFGQKIQQGSNICYYSSIKNIAD